MIYLEESYWDKLQYEDLFEYYGVKYEVRCKKRAENGNLYLTGINPEDENIMIVLKVVLYQK